MTLSGAPRLNSYGIHFPIDWNGRSVLVVVPHEALHKAEAALTGGPLDEDPLVAFERHRSVFETIAVRKLGDSATEADGRVRVTSDDLSLLGR
jgi:Protein of unknown function (DUF1488)